MTENIPTLAVTLGTLIQAVTPIVERKEQLIKDYVDEREHRFRGRFSGKTGRVYLDEKDTPCIEGELFKGIDAGKAVDDLERRMREEAPLIEEANKRAHELKSNKEGK